VRTFLSGVGLKNVGDYSQDFAFVLEQIAQPVLQGGLYIFFRDSNLDAGWACKGFNFSAGKISLNLRFSQR
jgi:hypothetical protein